MTARTIIAIDGIDGSGKSTFARGLLAALAAHGHHGTIVSVDDFRRPVAWNTLDQPEVDVYYDAYYDLALAERCLRAFLAGEPRVTIPNYDLLSERIEGTRELVFEGASIALVEGVFPLRIPAVQDGLIVFLEASPTEARQRIIARDLQKRRTREETERRIERRYFPAQQRYHAACAPRERADVIIDNERPAEARAVKRELARVAGPLRGLLDRLLPPLR